MTKAKRLHSISIKTEESREGGYPQGMKTKQIARNKELHIEKKDFQR